MSLAKNTLSDVRENLFGDCLDFIRQFPITTRQDWKQFGELVAAYNGLCRK